MTFKQVIDVYEMLDSAYVTGEQAAQMLREVGVNDVTVTKVSSTEGATDFVKALIRGVNGKSKGGTAPTLGIIGRLGGVGARPERIGFVSDGDGALAALAAAVKLGTMQQKGDALEGDVIVATHICPNAPTRPHDPVPFMSSPIDMETKNLYEVDSQMDAILSVDTTKGNRVINCQGFAISPTVKEGYILRISEDLLGLAQIVSGRLPAVFPLAIQDITPYGNGLYHLNSIMQPCTATTVPVVGVAITTEAAVPGCATGATHLADVDATVRFMIEVAKDFTQEKCRFYDSAEFAMINELYGPLKHFQKNRKN